MKKINIKMIIGFGLSPSLAGFVLGIVATIEEIRSKGFIYESYIVIITSVPFSIASVVFYGIPLSLLGAINSALNTTHSFRSIALSSVAGGSLCYAWSLAILYLSKVNKNPSEISHDTFPARPYGDDFLIFVTAALISMTASLALFPRHKNTEK